VHAPLVFGDAAIEERVHDIDSLVSELVGFDDALIAHHLHNEPTLRLVVPLLHADLTAIYCAVASKRIVQSTLEDGE